MKITRQNILSKWKVGNRSFWFYENAWTYARICDLDTKIRESSL